jgi:hypothetical protein
MGIPRFREAAPEEGLIVRVTSAIAAVGLVIYGVIFADILTHPDGTKAAANGIVSIEKPGFNALLGSTS